MNIYKGTIITCDKNNTIASYLVEDHGKVMWVGDELPMIYDIYPIIDLEDQVIMPSFADTHMHFASYATFHAGVTYSHHLR